MRRKRKQQNPHAELCAWANGLRADSPQYEDEDHDPIGDDANREMLGDDADIMSSGGYGEIGNK